MRDLRAALDRALVDGFGDASDVKCSVTRIASPRSKRIAVSVPSAPARTRIHRRGWMWRSAEASSCELSARCRSAGLRPLLMEDVGERSGRLSR